MILSTHGIVGSQITQFVGLLDLYPNAAAAYSLRKLRAAYSGSAIRVRRASDNAEQDIGFVNNVLDTASLTSFCSGTNGFVKTWYDQSGNARNAEQTTAANQPQIVSSGSVILENGNPTIQNTATKGLKTTAVNLSVASNLSIFSVYKNTSTLEGFIIESSANTNNNNGGFFISQSNTTILTVQKTSGYCVVEHNSVSFNQQIISTYLKANTTQSDFSDVSQNNSLLTPTLSPINNTNSVAFRNDILSLFSRNASSIGLIGNYQEFILYSNDQISNNTGINTNINSFYSIY